MTPETPTTPEGCWQVAAAFPGRTAIVEPDGSLVSFGQLAERSNRVSHALLELGVGDGGCVAVMAGNSADLFAFILGAAQIGTYFTLVNSHLSWPEASLILEDAAASVLVLDAAVEARVGVQARDRLGQKMILSLDRETQHQYLHDWTAEQPTTAPPNRTAGAPVFYTSGTSGRPKGVQPTLSLESPEVTIPALLTLLTRHGIAVDDIREPGVHLMTSPAYHAAPMYRALLALHLGHTVVVMRRFDAQASLRLIEQYRVTWTQVVPTMMQRWMDLPTDERLGIDTSSLRWLFHAAAPCPRELKLQVIEWLGPIVYEYYSSTEGGGTAIDSLEWLEHRGSVGRAWPGADIKILDASYQSLAPGEAGDVYFRSTADFAYRNDPDKTAKARHGDYVTVYDVGFLDPDGYLYLLDRRDDLILRGGVNIYPAEVEDTLRRHPLVCDAAVIGLPDPGLGQVVHAVVEPVDGADPDALRSSLHTFCGDNLASHKHPRSLQLVASIPRSEAGKLLRRVVRDHVDALPTYPC